MMKRLAFFLIVTFNSSAALAEENPLMDELFEVIVQWMNGSPNVELHDELVGQLKLELSGDAKNPNVRASMWADWVFMEIAGGSKELEKHKTQALHLLQREITKGNKHASKALLFNFLNWGFSELAAWQSEEPGPPFLSSKKTRNQVDALWKDIVGGKEFYLSNNLITLDEYRVAAWNRGHYLSPYYDLNESLNLYDFLIKTDPNSHLFKFHKLNTLAQTSVIVDNPGLVAEAHKLIDEIIPYALEDGALRFNGFLLHINIIRSASKTPLSVDTFNKISALIYSNEEQIEKRHWKHFLELLLNQKSPLSEELEYVFEKSGASAELAGELLADAKFKGIQLDAAFQLVLAKSILHEYLSNPSKKSEIEPGFYISQIGMPLYVGFSAALVEQDLDSMLYLLDAVKFFLQHPYVINSPVRKEFDVLLHSMDAQFSAYNGDVLKTYEHGKKALDLLISETTGIERVPGEWMKVYEELFALGLMVGQEDLFGDLIADYVFSPAFNNDFHQNPNKNDAQVWLSGLFGAALAGDEERFLKYRSINEKAFHEALNLTSLRQGVNAINFYWRVIEAQDMTSSIDRMDYETIFKDLNFDHIDLFVALKIVELMGDYDIEQKVNFLHQITTSTNRYLAHLISKGRVPSKVYRRSLNKLISEMYLMDLGNTEEFQTLVSLSQTLMASRSVQFRHLDAEAKKNVFAHTSFKEGIGFLKSDINIQKQSTTFREIQEALKEDQAVIFSVMNDKSSLVVSITPSEVQYYDSPLGLREAVKLKSNILSSMDGEFDVDSSLRLYKELFSKAVSALPSATKELLFLPPEELSDLPLSLLATQFDSEKHDAYISGTDLASRGFVRKSISSFSQQAKFLIEDYALSIIPSLKSVAGNENDSEGELTFLGVGAPLLTGDFNASNVIATRSGKVFSTQELHNNLIPLPDALEELKDTASYFPNAKLLIGQEATEANLKLALNASYNVISFATHALKYNELLETQEPSLVLSLEDGSDGLLSQSEILDYDLTGTDLVMLSACNTATAAAHLQSSSFTGLASSFLASGAKRVLVSHWPVISEAAKEIAIRTFKSPQKSYAKKLQNALIELINSDNPLQRNPKYWGAFTLIQG